MYKVYVIAQQPNGSRVLPETRTGTPAFAAAQAAFWALYGDNYDPTHLLLMTKNGKQINAYRYQSKPGERDFVAPGTPLCE